jgi:hypothetical protein
LAKFDSALEDGLDHILAVGAHKTTPSKTIPLLVILEARLRFSARPGCKSLGKRLPSLTKSVLESGVRDLIGMVDADAEPRLQNLQIVTTLMAPGVVSMTGKSDNCSRIHLLTTQNSLSPCSS